MSDPSKILTQENEKNQSDPTIDSNRDESQRTVLREEANKSIYDQTNLLKSNSSERRKQIRTGSNLSKETTDMITQSNVNQTNSKINSTDESNSRIKFSLGDEDPADADQDNRSHALFIELNELVSDGNKSQDSNEPIKQGWKETARWIKFEEEVESGGRWSKPHVATLSLHSLLELRNFMLNGTVILNMQADQWPIIIDSILDDLTGRKLLRADKRFLVRNSLLIKHVHQYEKEFHHHLHSQDMKKILPITRSFAELTRNRSNKDFTLRGNDSMTSASGEAKPIHGANTNSHEKFLSVAHKDPSKSALSTNTDSGASLVSNESRAKLNTAFMRKIPANAEATNVLIGGVDYLTTPIFAFVRLVKGTIIPDLIEVPLPIRFLIVLLGPTRDHLRYHEIGRSIATVMADEIFHDVAYQAHHRQDLLAGIDDFLDHVTVLPPGEWDPKTRIEPPKTVPNKEDRLERDKANNIQMMTEIKPIEYEEPNPALTRTGRFCGGLIDDIKRKAPFYISDFKDAWSFQSVAAIIFLYFACLSPIITFGGLLSKATDNNMAAIESLLSGAICGTLYHLFAGQPLAILGSTGPVLVFETILNHFCTSHGYDYMNFRCWIGIWTTLFLLIMVVTDASYTVKYITRFTEESFAALIGIIFIYEAFHKIIGINKQLPVRLHTNQILPSNCSCLNFNFTSSKSGSTTSIHECFRNQAYIFNGETCPSVYEKKYVPDVFFFSILLFISTFVLAYTLKNFKFSRFFPMTVRSKISDFGVVSAIFINVMIDYFVGLETPKLIVPKNFATTKPGRGWIINPLGNNSVYLWIGAIIPALFATILIFMDQQITAVIVNRKENKLKKGYGYHLDLLIVALCIGANSILGLPWFVAATVLSINHVIALKRESETAAPGEKPKFLGVREQRVTGFVVFVLIGLSVFLTKFLGFIPMPVLYGVFLYMGISSMKEIQLISRIFLIFMPEKYQPDYVYLRHVRTSRVHLFTMLQLACLLLLWIIKSIKSISILFPIMVLALVGARKMMDYVFTQRELSYLDDVMPDVIKKMKEQHESLEKENINDGKTTDEKEPFLAGARRFSANDAQISALPVEIKFSDEVKKTSIWKSITEEKMNVNEKLNSQPKASRASGIKNRLRRFSLNFRSVDEDRTLDDQKQTTVDSTLPAIIIEQTEVSVSNDPSSSCR